MNFAPSYSIELMLAAGIRYAQIVPLNLCSAVSCRSATGSCEWRTCPRSLRGG